MYSVSASISGAAALALSLFWFGKTAALAGAAPLGVTTAGLTVTGWAGVGKEDAALDDVLDTLVMADTAADAAEGADVGAVVGVGAVTAADTDGAATGADVGLGAAMLDKALSACVWVMGISTTPTVNTPLGLMPPTKVAIAIWFWLL
ncbi:MAG: hypothetical protein ACOVKR_02095 [Limnohabitans sp.]